MADLASLYIKVDSKGVVTASKDLDNLTGKSKGAEKATESVTKSFSKLQAVVVALASSYALLKMAQYIKDTALLAARYETLGVVMRVVGNNAGYSGEQTEEFARGLQKSGIAMIESRNTLARMIQAQIDLTNSQKLARIAQDAAVIGNINSSEAFERMIYGLQTGMPRILRTIGLNVDFNASVKALAVSLGIKKDALNKAQIMQGRVNAVMKAGVLIEGTYEAAMGTAGKKLTSFIRYVEDFKVKMGEAFGPATVMLVDAATEAMKDMQEQISRPEAQEALRELSSQLAETIVKIGKDLPKAIETMAAAVGVLADAFSEIVSIWTHPVWDKMDKFFGIVSDKKWQEGMRSAANKISPEFHKISESMDKFLSQYEKMQEMLAKGITTRLDFALEDPDKFFGEMIAEKLAWEKEGFESIEKWYKRIETLAQEKMDSISELENEETKVFEENLAYRFVVLKKYYEDIETAAQEARDFDEEMEDQLLRSARETAAYQKELADEKYDDMTNAMMGWANSFSSTLNDMLWGAEVTFKSILESFAKMITQMMIQKSIIEPMFSESGGWFGAALGWLSGLGGGVPGGTGPITYAAQGGIFPGGISGYSNQVVNTPTQFAFARGLGLMGEAGPEAIMPLTRTPSGDLGVKAEGGGNGGSTIVIMANDAKSFGDMINRNPESIIAVVGEALEGRTGLLDTIRATI